jgi:tripartite-type tricarboxylate transporter receptor subunit TctC
MKFFIAVFLFLFFSKIANATEVEFVNIYPPGSATDQQISALAASLEKNGIKVKRTFIKGCSDASRYVSTKKSNTFITTVATEWSWVDTSKGLACPPLDSLPTVKAYSRLAEFSLYLCSVPGSTIKNFNDLTRAKKVTVATPYSSAHRFVEKFAESANLQDRIKPIPYNGGAGVKLAVTAREVDLFLTGGHYKAFVKEGATCFAATAKNTPNDIKFLGDLAGVPSLNEHAVINILSSVGSIDSNITQALKQAFDSPEFKESLAIVDGVHRGLGAGETSESLVKYLRTVEINSK